MENKTIKMAELLGSVNTLNAIYIAKMPLKTSYKISKNLKLINKELENYNEQRARLLDECVLKDEKEKPVSKGENQVTIDPEKINQWREGQEELLILDVDISGVQTVSLEEFESINCELTPNEVETISYMIDD